MRPLLAAALLLLWLVPPSWGQASATCQRTANALNPSQRGQLAAWIKNDANGTDLSVDHLCPIDANQAIVALADFRGLASMVYVATFADAGMKMRRLLSGAIEAPGLLRPPSGGLFLVYASQSGGRAALERRVVLLNLENGAEQILASGRIGGNCGPGGRLVRLYPRIADVNGDRQPDIVIEREIEPCDQGKTVRSQEEFLADGAGYRKR